MDGINISQLLNPLNISGLNITTPLNITDLCPRLGMDLQPYTTIIFLNIVFLVILHTGLNLKLSDKIIENSLGKPKTKEEKIILYFLEDRFYIGVLFLINMVYGFYFIASPFLIGF